MKLRKAAAATLAVTVLAAAAPISGNLQLEITALAESSDTRPFKDLEEWGIPIYADEGTNEDSFTVSYTINGKTDTTHLYDGDTLTVIIKPAAGYAIESAWTGGKGWEDFYYPTAEGIVEVEYTAQYMGETAGVQAGNLYTHGLYVITHAVEDSGSDSESSDVESSDVESSDTESSDKPVEIKDEATKITVSAAEEVIPEGAALSVAPVASKTDENNFTYEISFKKDNKEVQPNGNVTVKIPVPKSIKGKTIYVYYVVEAKYTDMNAKVEDGFAVFTTEHFSEYLLTAEKHDETTSDSSSSTDSEASDTGSSADSETSGNSGSGSDSETTPDTGVAGIYLTLGIAALAGAAVVVARKKRQ